MVLRIHNPVLMGFYFFWSKNPWIACSNLEKSLLTILLTPSKKCKEHCPCSFCYFFQLTFFMLHFPFNFFYVTLEPLFFTSHTFEQSFYKSTFHWFMYHVIIFCLHRQCMAWQANMMERKRKRRADFKSPDHLKW